MSFNTGGQIVYLTAPTKTSDPHAVQASHGMMSVFTTVPSGDTVEATSPEGVGTVVPEPLIGGRIVG